MVLIILAFSIINVPDSVVYGVVDNMVPYFYLLIFSHFSFHSKNFLSFFFGLFEKGSHCLSLWFWNWHLPASASASAGTKVYATMPGPF